MLSFGQNGSGWSARPAVAVGPRLFRADLHVHSRRSRPGHCTLRDARRERPEPEAIYRVARERGMGLVTLTDLDTIDGCLEVLDRHPEADDLVISEEIAAREPRSGSAVHVLLFGISEAQHREAARLKGDVHELAAYVRREGILASLGPFLDLLGAGGDARPLREIVGLFERVEIRNGAEGRAYNDLVARLVQEAAPGGVRGVTAGAGGSSLWRIGRTTTVSRAASPGGFLEELRLNRTWAVGGWRGPWASALAALGTLAPRRGARPAWERCARRARLGARIRRAKRRLDRCDVLSFQEKTRSFQPD